MTDLPRGGKTAFVLAGGGTKGSFEAGALQYVVGTEGIIPDIVTATSAGAIAAAVLAQARTLSEFSQRVQEIEDDILAMTRTEYVFGQADWLRALKGTSLGDSIQFALTEGTRPAVAGDPTVDGTSAPTDPSPRAQQRADRKLKRKKQRKAFRMVAGAAHRLPKVRRKLGTSGTSALNLQPLGDALRRGGPSGIRPINPDLIRRPGLELRLAVTALRAGVLRYITEDGTIVEEDARTPVAGSGSGPVDFVDGVLASASVPMIFPPRPLADDDYVDGGVIQVIPVRAAVQLGATRVVAVMAMPLALARDDHDFSAGHAADIGMRAIGLIGIADRQRENLAITLPAGTTLTTIDPVIDVVGLFEVEPGLLRINKDYGWLRAADVLAEGDPTMVAEVAAGTHDLVQARLRAWHLEETLWGNDQVTAQGQAGALALLREIKEQIYTVVDQRKQLGFPVPEGCEAWWTEYEVHGGLRPADLPPCPTPKG
ncbi:MAG TPA: patatin-like phospholipase family protein [Acidimicrobiales bacterium]|jgi:predicted acylesterase/phospholipase RssA|nr:patatin-like phospholipase family protein [Acidimicrobiales bacterium]